MFSITVLEIHHITYSYMKSDLTRASISVEMMILGLNRIGRLWGAKVDDCEEQVDLGVGDACFF